MRDIRVFTNQPLAVDAEVLLEENSTHHLTTVLRLKTGAAIVLFNGTGGEYHAILGQATGKQARVLITGFTETNRESPLYISLGIGLSRGDRMDWVIQKATEVGIAEITPLFTARSEVRLKGDRADKKIQHWRKIAINACEQCYRNIPPLLMPQFLLTFGLNLYLQTKTLYSTIVAIKQLANCVLSRLTASGYWSALREG